MDIKSPCIEWTGGKSVKGYGQVRMGSRTARVHRLEYEKHFGPIPAGMLVRHKCDNPSCFNIDHLELGTPKQNTADRVERGRCAGTAKKGELNGSAKLCEADVTAIRASTEAGLSLAARYSVSPTTISQIRHRQKWAHVA